MVKVCVTRLPNGRVGIITLSPIMVVNRADFDDQASFDLAVGGEEIKQLSKLPKTLFELSRTSDIGHFDSSIHTLTVIAAGVPGHVPLEYTEMDDETDLPANRAERFRWKIDRGKVVIDPTIPEPI